VVGEVKACGSGTTQSFILKEGLLIVIGYLIIQIIYLTIPPQYSFPM
jgi:hypothetical protein